ncbi:hypothetical protein [Terrimonas alba]|uniref:hypothetical protein n=1 Tax=Terrimonas alba TaxID=3349636 RepID=UPI0035F4D992
MTLYQFNDLDEMEQMEAIWTGVKIAERIEGSFKIDLIQIDSFYVELYFIEDRNLVRTRSFSSPEQLLPYMGQIDINSLLE